MRPHILRALGFALAAVVVVSGTAAATTEYWYWSRILAWREAQVDDFTRFPARSIENGANVFRFSAASGGGVPTTVTYRVGASPLHGPPDDLRQEVAGHVATAELDDFLARTGTTAFLVIRDQQLLYERYFNGHDRESIQTSFSIAKSVVSALVGIAIAEGRIDGVDAPVTRYLPELRGRGLEAVSIRHLLTMSSGLAYRGEGSGGTPWDDDARTYFDPDLRTLALGVQPAAPPGTRWQYNNYHPLLLGMILERVTGRSVSAYLSEKLWQPLGMEAPGSWSLDSLHGGFEKMESGINARAIDFAKFAVLYLNAGSWGGRQLLPRAWADESTRLDTTSDPADFYQYMWWVDVGAEAHRFLARGNYGQFLYVAPDRNLVIVRFGTRAGYDRWPELLRELASRTAVAPTTP